MVLDQKNLPAKMIEFHYITISKNLIVGLTKLLKPKKFNTFSKSIFGEFFTEQPL